MDRGVSVTLRLDLSMSDGVVSVKFLFSLSSSDVVLSVTILQSLSVPCYGLTPSFITRPRRPGFKGHPIEFMIILDPIFTPNCTPMDPFEPIWTYLDLMIPFEPI